MQVVTMVAGILAEPVVALVESEYILAEGSRPMVVQTRHRFSWMTAAIGGIEHPG